MSTDTEKPETPDAEEPAPDVAAPSESPASDSDPSATDDIDVGSPEFQDVTDSGSSSGKAADLNRFQDIKVNVSADLGRAEVPIQTLMNIGEGSVLELDRTIDSPVELVAQGVPLACGEVVVVNGCFAIRVTQVYENQKG